MAAGEQESGEESQRMHMYRAGVGAAKTRGSHQSAVRPAPMSEK